MKTGHLIRRILVTSLATLAPAIAAAAQGSGPQSPPKAFPNPEVTRLPDLAPQRYPGLIPITDDHHRGPAILPVANIEQERIEQERIVGGFDGGILVPGEQRPAGQQALPGPVPVMAAGSQSTPRFVPMAEDRGPQPIAPAHLDASGGHVHPQPRLNNFPLPITVGPPDAGAGGALVQTSAEIAFPATVAPQDRQFAGQQPPAHAPLPQASGQIQLTANNDFGQLLSGVQPNPPVPPNAEPVPPANDNYAGDTHVGEECYSGCCRGPIWTIGTEATFLGADVNNSNVRYVVEDFITPATYRFSADDDNPFFASPRIWLGVQGQCWGLVGRYWRMGDGARTFDPFINPPGVNDTGFLTHYEIEAYAADLEVTRTFCHHDSKLTASFGVRYALFEVDESVLGFANVGNDVLIGTATSHRRAFGTGLTGALNGRKPLFCNSCLNLFYNLRGSVLWGEGQSLVQTSSTITDPIGNAGAVTGAAVTDSETMFIGEIQLGVEWNYQLKWLPASAFFRVAAEYQYWDGGEGDADSIAFAGQAGVAQGTATAQAHDLRMNLYGVSLGTGFTW